MPKRLIALIIGIYFTGSVHPQATDSLRRAWSTWSSGAQQVHDTLGVRCASDLSKALQEEGALDSALIYSAKAIALAERGVEAGRGAQRTAWLRHRMVAERMHAAQLFFLNRYPESIEAIKAYLATAEELQLPEEIGAAYNYLGYCYTTMEDLPSALKWTRKAMETMRGIGGGIDLANACTGLGNVLDELGHYDSAMVYLRQAIALHKELDRPNNHAAAYFSAIETWRHLDQPDSVAHYLAQVKPLVDLLDQPRSHMHYLSLLGQYEAEQGRPGSGIPHLLKADTLALEIEDHRSRHYINRALAMAYAAARRCPQRRLPRRPGRCRNERGHGLGEGARGECGTGQSRTGEATGHGRSQCRSAAQRPLVRLGLGGRRWACGLAVGRAVCAGTAERASPRGRPG